MVAVLHIVPVHPGNRVELDTKVPRLSDFSVPGAFIAVDGPGILVPPQAQQHSHFIAAQVVQMRVSALLLVRCNQIGFRAVCLCPPLGILDQHPSLNQDIGLALHIPAVGIAEHNLRVHQDFRADSALAGLPGIHATVPVCIGASVRIYGGVPAELTDAATHFVVLEDGGKLVVQNVRQQLRHVGGELPAAGQPLGVELQVVRGHVGNREQHHTFQEVKNRGWEAVGLDALPLFSDEEIFVGLYAVVQLNALVKRKPGFIFLGHLLRRHFIFHVQILTSRCRCTAAAHRFPGPLP